MGGIWKVRRQVLAVAGIAWLAGFQFFHDGFYHLGAFWLVLAPLAVANLDLLRDGQYRGWLVLLAGLLGWQTVCMVVGAGQVAGAVDALAVGLLAVVVVGIARLPGGVGMLRLGVFATAVVAAGWSLVRFYPLSDLGLADERLRNVLVYPVGLNAVLTGLLIGFSMIAGLGLGHRGSGWRWAVWAGLMLLGFALMASQSRGALLAAGAGVVVRLLVGRRELLVDVAACGLGALGYLLVFAMTAEGGGPDLVERGATGRLEIWQSYLGGLDVRAWWIGTGGVPPLDEGVLGWHVHHPHSAWVSQLVWCGLPGLALLGGLVGWGAVAGWRIREWDAVPLALLIFGLTGLSFDGAQVVSLVSVPRIEPLLVLVPVVLALAAPVAMPAEGGAG